MTRSASEALISTTFDGLFPPQFLTVVSQFIAILKKKTFIIEFLLIKFRLKSFLELHVHFNGFICIRMRKLHAESQIQADACD